MKVRILSKKTLILVLAIFAGYSCIAAQTQSYTVVKGDTLYSISRKYSIAVKDLCSANGIGQDGVIKVGQVLVIPSAGGTSSSAPQEMSAAPAVRSYDVYTVQKGDTLYGIARKYGIKLPELLAMNNLDNNATIKIGQKLTVPGTVSAAKNEPAKVTQKQLDSTQAEASKQKVNTAVSVVSGVTWPLANPSVRNISGKVSGVQLTGRENEAVKCIREGTVMYTGVYRGFGDVVFIQSKTGLIYSYTGLGSVKAKKGDYVLAGTEIGRTGKGSESSIKFMVFQNGKPVDPVKAPRG